MKLDPSKRGTILDQDRTVTSPWPKGEDFIIPGLQKIPVGQTLFRPGIGMYIKKGFRGILFRSFKKAPPVSGDLDFP